MKRREALLQWLRENDYPETENDDIKDNGGCFEAHGNEYRVLTDDEATEATKDDIRESLFAFNYNFLCGHSEPIACMGEEAFKSIQAQCEDANLAIKAMIDDWEDFVSDATSTDGRGHFLSFYDGEEHEQGEWFIYRTN